MHHLQSPFLAASDHGFNSLLGKFSHLRIIETLPLSTAGNAHVFVENIMILALLIVSSYV